MIDIFSDPGNPACSRRKSSGSSGRDTRQRADNTEGDFLDDASRIEHMQPTVWFSLVAQPGERKEVPMIRRGVEFTLVQVEPELWKWEFQIDKTVTTGKTKSNLMGMAARRAQQRIDQELKKTRELAARRSVSFAIAGT